MLGQRPESSIKGLVAPPRSCPGWGSPTAARPLRGRTGSSSRLAAEAEPQHPAGTRGPAKPKHHSSPPSPTGSGPLGNTHPRAEKAPAAPASLPFVPRSPRPSRRSFRARTFHTLRGIFCGPRPALLRRTALPVKTRQGLVRQRFFFFRLLGSLRSLSIWILSQPGADSSRRGGRRRLGRVAGPGSRPGGRNCADCVPRLH